MRSILGCFAAVGLALVATACSKNHDSGMSAATDTMAAVAPPIDCGHAVCATNFFIDTAVPDCTAGSPCGMTLKLVATGEFHINDEYPYKFRADDAPGVEFLGTDTGGTNVFSKAAGDWKKAEEKTGSMTVKFRSAERGTKTVAGTLKLSVCSPQNCLLEQRQLAASVLTK